MLEPLDPVAMQAAEAQLPQQAEPLPALPWRTAVAVDAAWAAGVLLLVALVFVLLKVSTGVGIPLFLALATAYVLGPVAASLEQRGVRRDVAVSAVFFGAALAVLGLVLLVVPPVVDEGMRLPDLLQKALLKVQPVLEKRFGVHVSANLNRLGTQAGQWLATAGQDVMPYVLRAVGSTAGLLVTVLGLAIAPALAFMLLLDAPDSFGTLRALLPPRFRAQVLGRFAELDRVLGAFVRGQLKVGAILFVLYLAGLTLAGIDIAPAIALIAGFGNIVPYLGQGSGLVLAGLSLLVESPAGWQVAAALGTFVVCNLLESLVITPRIVGRSVGLSPVAVIVAVLAFGDLLGFVGVLLAVPTTAALTVVGRVMVERYLQSPAYLGTKGEPT